jgi:uncharacterized protein YjiS (DUF1127 family)
MFENISDRVRRWRDYRRALNELDSLSDRELAELGLFRCDLPRVARDSVKR